MSQDYTYIPDLLAQNGEIPAGSILSQTIYGDDQLKAILFTFAEGQELSEHSSAQTALLHFLQGEAELTLGDDTLTAQPGTWVRMPPRLSHSIVAKTPVTML